MKGACHKDIQRQKNTGTNEQKSSFLSRQKRV